MITIRDYKESDSVQVGILIADTYSQFNLTFASPEEQAKLLGPFAYARSVELKHRDAIAKVIQATMVYVAEDGDEIVGVLRGRPGRLQSLFVSGARHKQGIGRTLVEHYEAGCIKNGAPPVKVAATLYAVAFYRKLGYKKTTGVRPGWSFGGTGLLYQPMKKILVNE